MSKQPPACYTHAYYARGVAHTYPHMHHNHSLCGLDDIQIDDVAPLVGLTSLTSLTLLAAHRPPALARGGPPPFAPLASLPALQRALLGCARSGGGSDALGWAAAGGWVEDHGAVIAYLCPAAWKELASFQVFKHAQEKQSSAPSTHVCWGLFARVTACNEHSCAKLAPRPAVIHRR